MAQYVVISLFLLACLYALIKPSWALLLVVCFFPLEQLLRTYVGFFATHTWFLNVMIAGVAALSVTRSYLSDRESVRGYFNPTIVLIYALYALVVAGYLYSPSQGAARMYITRGAPYFVLMVVLFPLLLRRVEDLRDILVPFMMVGSAIIVLLILSPSSAIEGGRLTIEIPNPTGIGTQRGNPLATSTLGSLLVITAALAKPKRAGSLVMMIRIGAIFVGMGIALLAGGRGQVIATIGVVLVAYPMSRHIRNLNQFIVISAGLAAFVLLVYGTYTFFFSEELAGRWTARSLEGAVENRMAYARAVLEAYITTPVAWLLGLGTSAFVFYYFDNMTNFGYPHNLTVQILTEHGLVGFAIFVGIVLTLVFASRRMLKDLSNNPSLRAAAAVAIAWALFEFMIAHKQGTFVGMPAPFYALALVARLAARTRIETVEAAGKAAVDDGEYVEYGEDPHVAEAAYGYSNDAGRGGSEAPTATA